jgi:hypothetical protein
MEHESHTFEVTRHRFGLTHAENPRLEALRPANTGARPRFLASRAMSDPV